MDDRIVDEGGARYREDPRGSSQRSARPRSARPQTWPEPPQATWPEPPGFQEGHSNASTRNEPSAQAQQTRSSSTTKRAPTPSGQQDYQPATKVVKRGWFRRLFRSHRHGNQRQGTDETTRDRPVRALPALPSHPHDRPQQDTDGITKDRPAWKLPASQSHPKDRPQQDTDETTKDHAFTDAEDSQPWPRFTGKEDRRSVLDIARKILSRALKEVSHFKEAFRRLGLSGIETSGTIADYTDSDFSRCLETLDDRSLWDAFLREEGLANNHKAVEAIDELIERIQDVTRSQIAEDSLTLLEISIKLLLNQINSVDARSVSQERVQHLKESVEKIGWQVAAASATISATTTVGGSELTSRVILAGLSGSAAATLIGSIQSWRNHAQKSRSSAPNLLCQLHDDMIERVDVLLPFIMQTSERAIETPEEKNLVRVTLLQARFLAMYARLVWAGSEQFSQMIEYQSYLATLSNLLNEVDECIKKRTYRALPYLEQEISPIRSILRLYRSSLVSLR